MNALDAERDALLREHAELMKAFEGLRGARPFDADAHRDHLIKLHDHIVRLHGYIERVRGHFQYMTRRSETKPVK